jgi:putative transposase
MPRAARIVVPGSPHHITQRGNNQQDVFFDDSDRMTYLDILGKQSRRHGLSIDAYCLMTNHVHLVGVPSGTDSLARTMAQTDLIYTQYVNRIHGRSGHLWQNRFYSCATDETHFWSALAYVELNPVRAGIVETAWDYRWSSAAVHCGKSDASRLLDTARWRKNLSPGVDWQESLTIPLDKKEIALIRLCTSRGRPYGAETFVKKLEAAIGKRIHALPSGRPKKGQN